MYLNCLFKNCLDIEKYVTINWVEQCTESQTKHFTAWAIVQIYDCKLTSRTDLWMGKCFVLKDFVKFTNLCIFYWLQKWWSNRICKLKDSQHWKLMNAQENLLKYFQYLVIPLLIFIIWLHFRQWYFNATIWIFPLTIRNKIDWWTYFQECKVRSCNSKD